jgi:hypothetical protein
MKYKKKLNQRGQFSYVFILLIIFISLLVVFAVVAPIMTNMSVAFYSATQPLQNSTTAIINTFEDANMRSIALADIQSQKDMQALNIQTLTTMATYGGIIIVIAVVLVFFLLARRNVESGSIA